MKPGSVIVDLAAEQGGNCELSEPGKVAEKHGVTIVAHKNVPSRIAASAAALYAKNLLNLAALVIRDGALTVNWDDDIVKGIALTHGGQVVHPLFGDKAK
jgi:NAD(P) transhydrogenase subunit alpha